MDSYSIAMLPRMKTIIFVCIYLASLHHVWIAYLEILFSKGLFQPVLGRGVFTKSEILPGQFLAQYAGELLDETEGEKREAEGETGFRYFFQHHRTTYWYWADFSTYFERFNF